MRYSTIRYIQLMIVAISLIALIGIGIVVARMAGYNIPQLTALSFFPIGESSPREQIALVSGHAGFDSGAICTDSAGNTISTEAEINAAITDSTARRLRDERLDVLVLEEYDDQQQGLEAALLVSLHSDSCIDSSGYKAARHPNSQVADQADLFLACLDEHYAPQTRLTYHANTLTHDMFEYHAFSKVAPQTPAVILEMGFMGGDHQLLSTEQSLVAKAITDSILCFLKRRGEDNGSVQNDADREN